MPWSIPASPTVLPTVGAATRVIATDMGRGRVVLYLRDDRTGVLWFVRLRLGYQPQHSFYLELRDD
eukprot:407052-Lingulodinium_polyedra.AAC.1